MTDLERIESKLDRLLFLLGEGRGRSAAEIHRLADADFLRLQNRKPKIKKEHERAEPIGHKAPN